MLTNYFFLITIGLLIFIWIEWDMSLLLKHESDNCPDHYNSPDDH